MSISQTMKNQIASSADLSRMFGLKSVMLSDGTGRPVYDFSIGNPDLLPPETVRAAILDVANENQEHGYTPTAGWPVARKAVAKYISKEQDTTLEFSNIIMTAGAAGGLNCIFKTLLDPGDEVILIGPYFVEYPIYVHNHGGIARIVSSNQDFSLNLDNISAAINSKTRAILINSPNNPTGKIYTQSEITALAKLLQSSSLQIGRPIYLVSDEPYRNIIFDQNVLAKLMPHYNDVILVGSFSKDMSLAGERIGYVAVHPKSSGHEAIEAGVTLANRILGFVNAPSLIQRVIAKTIGTNVDVQPYQSRRDALVAMLKDVGYSCQAPEGGFFMLLKCPIADDQQFVETLLKERILALPGKMFGRPGYFRLSILVSLNAIQEVKASFAKVLALY